MLFKYLAKCLLLFSCYFLLNTTSLVFAVAQSQEEGIAGFEEAAITIDELVDSNTALAQSQLKPYGDRFNDLSLKQKITYLDLLTDIYILQGQFHLAKQATTEGLSLTLKLSSPSLLISELLYNRGFANESIGETELATIDYENGLELAKSLKDNVLIARGLVNLGAIYYLTDRYENSLIVLNDAYNIAKQTKDDKLKGSVNSELGILYAHLDRHKQAMVYYQQSYQHYKNANKTVLSLTSLVNIALNHLSEKQYEQAITAFKTIITEAKGSDEFALNQIMYSTYSGLSWANIKKENPNPEASFQYLLLSKKYVENIEQYDVERQYYTDEAFVLFELERFNEALDSIAKVEAIFTSHIPLGHIKKQAHIGIINLKSKIHFKLGHYQQAYELQDQRLSLTRALRDEKHTQSIAEVRLALEAKEADLQKKVLKNKQTLQEISLFAAEKEQQQQKLYLFYIAVVALIFAWLLVKLVQGQHRLYKASSLDGLTGVANRREVMKKGAKLFDQVKAKKTNFSVLMIDIDHFKKINDQYGHSSGDFVLKTVVELGKEFMRKTDVFGRYGSEEFVAFLPNTSSAQAKMIAERFRRSVDEYNWGNTQVSKALLNIKIKISISIGVANSIDFSNEESSDLNMLLTKADQLLNQAKKQGRNQVCT